MNPTGEQSEILGLPYILPSQAQKHVTHNEAIQMLDALVQLGVRDDALSEPPTVPVPGDRYIVGADATGLWENREGEVAAWQGGAWHFYLPREGWLAHVARDDRMVRYRDNAWGPLPTSGVTRSDLLGINAEATTTNRLTVSADATLLTAERNDHRLVVNRSGENNEEVDDGVRTRPTEVLCLDFLGKVDRQHGRRVAAHGQGSFEP